jgi:hypothetical protein
MLLFSSEISLTGGYFYVEMVFAGRYGAIVPIAVRAPWVVTLIKIQHQNTVLNITLPKIQIPASSVGVSTVAQVFER